MIREETDGGRERESWMKWNRNKPVADNGCCHCLFSYQSFRFLLFLSIQFPWTRIIDESGNVTFRYNIISQTHNHHDNHHLHPEESDVNEPLDKTSTSGSSDSLSTVKTNSTASSSSSSSSSASSSQNSSSSSSCSHSTSSSDYENFYIWSIKREDDAFLSSLNVWMRKSRWRGSRLDDEREESHVCVSLSLKTSFPFHLVSLVPPSCTDELHRYTHEYT